MFLKVSGIIIIESEVMVRGGKYILNYPDCIPHFAVSMLPALYQHGNCKKIHMVMA